MSRVKRHQSPEEHIERTRKIEVPSYREQEILSRATLEDIKKHFDATTGWHRITHDWLCTHTVEQWLELHAKLHKDAPRYFNHTH